MRAGDAAPGATSAHVSLHVRLAGAAATGAALFDLSRGRQALLSIAGAGLAAVLAAAAVAPSAPGDDTGQPVSPTRGS